MEQDLSGSSELGDTKMGVASFLVGIDLGTTNSSLSFISADPGANSSPTLLDHCPAQITQPFEWADRPLLPSFLYFSTGNDLPEGCLQLPWSPKESSPTRIVVGEFARKQGDSVPGQLVHSAKSWLSCPGADRKERILPWPGSENTPKISPVEASAAYLDHLAKSWAHTQGNRHTLGGQTVVITVPASFDDVARRLTLDAAKQAGIPNPLLLEEPQAAFYCWIAEQERSAELRSGMTILVVDVGGGTTDFSLIETFEKDGEIAFERKAIGDHLLLGGDNMDMALARNLEEKISPKSRLSNTQFQALIQQCRQAKEILLGDAPPDQFTIHLEGRGRSIVGGALNYDIPRDLVTHIVADGFFPLCPLDSTPKTPRRQGAVQPGLPYAQDAAITKHLASFLHQHHGVDKPPDAVLLNGGSFHSKVLCERILDFFRYNYPEKPVQQLRLKSVDRAVSRGAAYFAWRLKTGKNTIRSHAAKSYYLALEQNQKDLERVLCVLPGNSPEEHEHLINQHQFSLTLGEPVRFPLLSSTVRLEDKAGDIQEIEKGRLHPLPALHSVLTGGRKSGQRTCKVHLISKLSSIGTLDLFLVDENLNRWHLDFNLAENQSDASGSEKQPDGHQETPETLIPESLIEEALANIRAVFPDSEGPGVESPSELTKVLEKTLETQRENWSVTVCRRLWSGLLQGATSRRASPSHLSRWYNLGGWTLRPGFGHPQDSFQVEQLWKALHAPAPGKSGIRQPEGGAELWVLFRRVAGGLPPGKQTLIIERLKPFLLPSKSKPPFKPSLAEFMEMWRCAASLERIAPAIRIQLAEMLHKKLQAGPEDCPDWQIWCLGRLGCRRPGYASIASVLPRESVVTWLETLLKTKPKSKTSGKVLGLALAQIGLRTNNAALDIPEIFRDQIRDRLKNLECSTSCLELLDENDGKSLHSLVEAGLGESLPLGLQLVEAQQN
jgi:molecular chaperone DnaK (HSP70)